MPQDYEQRPEMRQRPVLSQQARVTLHVIQLPLMDLKEYLEQEMWENPMLEDKAAEEAGPAREDIETYEGEDPTRAALEHPGSYDEENGEKQRYRETLITKKETLEGQLLWQLDMNLEGMEHEIGEYLICSLDENGYLDILLEEAAEKFGVDICRIEEVLSVVQSFHPAGIAARDLRECLLLQLRSQGREDELIYRIVDECMGELEKREYAAIARKLKTDDEEVENVCEEMNDLDPKPGLEYSEGEAPWTIPDIILERTEDGYRVELNDAYIPVLRISRFYSSLAEDKSTDEATLDYLKRKREKAKWIINAIRQRQDTIRRITGYLVEFQKDFLETGGAGLKPLKLTDVAEKLGISESTVSRVVSRKYLQTDLGVMPLRSFFSSALKREDGDEISSADVKERIRDIISEEDASSPLSDGALSSTLKREGINIARRTVAKYREGMKILPAHLRRR